MPLDIFTRTTMAAATALKVAVLGPAGQCGSCVVDELLARGHIVTGMSRNPPKTWKAAAADSKNKGAYSAKPIDIWDKEALTAAFSGGFDAIVAAYAPPLNDLSLLYETGVEGQSLIKTALLDSDHEGSIIMIGREREKKTSSAQD